MTENSENKGEVCCFCNTKSDPGSSRCSSCGSLFVGNNDLYIRMHQMVWFLIAALGAPSVLMLLYHMLISTSRQWPTLALVMLVSAGLIACFAKFIMPIFQTQKWVRKV